MAGWFGPPDGDCSCCKCSSFCDIGKITTARYKVEISGAASVYTYTQPSGFGGDAWIEWTAAGLDAINGTYYVDDVVVDGCPARIGVLLRKYITVTYSMTHYAPGAYGCADPVVIEESESDCTYELVIESNENAIEEQILRVRLERNSVCVNTEELEWDEVMLAWLFPDDCDKVPSGSETVTHGISYHDGSSSVCTESPSYVTDDISVTATAMLS